jgi:hypothetical protein
VVTALDSWVDWRPCDDVATIATLCELVAAISDGLVSARIAELPFYDRRRLVELRFEGPDGTSWAYGLDDDDVVSVLDGSSEPIHDANESEELWLTDGTVLDYVRFFLFFLRADEGPFVLLESPSELDLDPDANPDEGRPEVERGQLLIGLRGSVAPPVMVPQSSDSAQPGAFEVACTVAYGDLVFGSVLEVTRDGQIDMKDDNPIGDLNGISVAWYPHLSTADSDDSEHHDEGEADERKPAEKMLDRYEDPDGRSGQRAERPSLVDFMPKRPRPETRSRPKPLQRAPSRPAAALVECPICRGRRSYLCRACGGRFPAVTHCSCINGWVSCERCNATGTVRASRR